jgi:hypothetical protein
VDEWRDLLDGVILDHGFWTVGCGMHLHGVDLDMSQWVHGAWRGRRIGGVWISHGIEPPLT